MGIARFGPRPKSTSRHPRPMGRSTIRPPGVTEEIERHARVRMNYQDLSGVEKIEEAEGLLSVCLQHEVDQLDGIFWIYLPAEARSCRQTFR
jgi:peptide deformylase